MYGLFFFFSSPPTADFTTSSCLFILPRIPPIMRTLRHSDIHFQKLYFLLVKCCREKLTTQLSVHSGHKAKWQEETTKNTGIPQLSVHSKHISGTKNKRKLKNIDIPSTIPSENNNISVFSSPQLSTSLSSLPFPPFLFLSRSYLSWALPYFCPLLLTVIIPSSSLFLLHSLSYQPSSHILPSRSFFPISFSPLFLLFIPLLTSLLTIAFLPRISHLPFLSLYISALLVSPLLSTALPSSPLILSSLFSTPPLLNPLSLLPAL